MNDDLKELLNLLNSHSVDYLVIGAHAVSFYARPRMTEDVDLWISRNLENVHRLKGALDEFGMAIGDEGAERFAFRDRQMIRLGVPPNMVDLLNFAGTHEFEDVWARRVSGQLEDIAVFFPTKNDLIEMKATAGRPQDLADIDQLRRLR